MLVFGYPILLDLGIKTLIFAFVLLACLKLKITTVPIFILVGLVSSPLIVREGALLVIAETGIVLLFFLLGLEYPLDKMIKIAKKIWFGGVLDIGVNLVIPMLAAYYVSLSWPAAFLVGGVTYASSSSITLKMLEDQKRFANPESDYMIALLIFEDIVAPIVVTLITVLYIQGEFTILTGAAVFGRVVFLIGISLLLAKFVFTRFADKFNHRLNEQFVLLFGVSMALIFSGLALLLGLSELLGAFLAGVMLSELKHPEKFDKVILPVRNITLPFFFVWFGAGIELGEGILSVPLLIFIIIWAVIGKIIVGIIGGKVFGLSKKAAIRGGFSLVQRGEFSVVIAAVAAAELRSFSGIYIVLTALIGMLFFAKASGWTDSICAKFLTKGNK
ncbi:MAG: cation:proton antiporter [Halanaerobium sp.]